MKAFEFGFDLRTWQMILHLSDKRAFDCIEHCTRLFHFVNLFESFEYVFKKFIQSKLYASSFRRFVMHLYHPINVCMFWFCLRVGTILQLSISFVYWRFELWTVCFFRNKTKTTEKWIRNAFDSSNEIRKEINSTKRHFLSMN